MEKIKERKNDIFTYVIIIILIALGIYVWFFYRGASEDNLMIAYEDINQYPVYNGRNVYEYWRGTLDENQQIMYDELKEAFLQFREFFTTSVDTISYDDFYKVYNMVFLDHPEIFWVDSYNAIQTLTKNVNTNKQIRIYYAFSIKEAQEIKDRIEEKYNQIIDGAKKETTDFKKIKYVHDKLIEISKYQEPLENSTQELQTIISIFDTGYSVCAGFANGFKFIMDNLGIESMSMQSVGNENKKENHIWNMVNLYGKWYNLDVTWDSLKSKEERYSYFLKDNDEFYTDHRMQAGMPANSET